DFHVTGVQTCALPIFSTTPTEPMPVWYASATSDGEALLNDRLNAVVAFYCTACHGGPAPMRELDLVGFDVSAAGDNPVVAEKMRSEERRVGNEGYVYR